MKTLSKIYSLWLLMLCLTASALSQPTVQRLDEQGNPIPLYTSKDVQFVKGQVLVKFKTGELDSLELEKDVLAFALDAQLMKRTALRTSLQSKLSTRGALRGSAPLQMQRVVTKLRPHHKTSTARTGASVPMPDFWNLMVLQVAEDADILKLCQDLSQLDGIEYAEPNFVLTLHDSPANDANYFLQRGLEQANDIDIDAARAWDFSTGVYTVKVGVIDNGVDYNNPDLGNGAFGFEGAKIRGGWDYFNSDGDPDDDNVASHGTACAGIIGALRNNTIGVAGIAGGNNAGNIGCQIFAFKAGGSDLSLSTNNCIDAIIEGSTYTAGYGYGCHILSNSYGSHSYGEAFRSAVRVAAQNNVIFVASTGNGENNNSIGQVIKTYPANYDASWTMAVGASNGNDQRPGFSNYGNDIDVVAPGTTDLVYTTVRNEVGSYNVFSGTSAAAPHVAGLAALLRSVNANLHPEDVQGIIRASADKVGQNAPNNPYSYTNGYNENVGYGRINAGKAMEMITGFGGWFLAQQTAYGGSIVSSTGTQQLNFTASSGSLASGIYYGKRHEVRKTVSVSALSSPFAWGRGANATTGWSAAYPNQQMGFCEAKVVSATTVELTTFVYEIQSNYYGQSINQWHPALPENVTFAYTTLGVPLIAPAIANITQSPNPYPTTTVGNTGSLACNLSQGNGSLSYQWTVVCNSGHFAVSNTTSPYLTVQYTGYNGSQASGDCSDALAAKGNSDVSAQALAPTLKFKAQCTVTNGAGGTTSNVYELVTGSAPPPGGGCPFVFSNTATGFEIDNNILHRSTFSENVGKDITDRYKLTVKPVKQNGKYKLLIKELNNDHSYFDRFKLFAVDHPANTELGITENGDYVLYAPQTVMSTHQADLNTDDVTKLVQYVPNPVGVSGAETDVLRLQYPSGSFRSASVNLAASEIDFGKLNSGDDDGAQIESVASGTDSVAFITNPGTNAAVQPPVTKLYAASVSTGNEAQRTMKSNQSSSAAQNSDGTEKVFARRERKSVVVLPLGTNASEMDSLQVNWRRNYDIGYAALTSVSYGGYAKRELSLITATHSVRGNVKSKLTGKDAQYAELDSAETIELSFNAGNEVRAGWVREFVLESVGRYEAPTENSDEFNATNLKATTSRIESGSLTAIPETFELKQNYPNPFNPSTTIQFGLPQSAKVSVRIYDMLGRVVSELVNDTKPAGYYAVSFDASRLSSGTYFYRLQAGEFVETKKMLLVK